MGSAFLLTGANIGVRNLTEIETSARGLVFHFEYHITQDGENVHCPYAGSMDAGRTSVMDIMEEEQKLP